jgi:hypothetical protein
MHLVNAARILHHLQIGDVITNSNRTTCADCTAILLILAAIIVKGLRRVHILLMEVPGNKQDEHAYSRRFLDMLRDEIDNVDLERALVGTIDGFALANPWFDDRMKRPRNGTASTFDPDNAGNKFIHQASRRATELHEIARQALSQDRQHYNCFRSRSLMLLARTRYLSGRDWNGSLALLSKAARLLPPPSPDSALDHVAVLRARAECLMLQANARLARGQKSRVEWIYSISFAARQLCLARSTLTRALQIVNEHRRRNVPWWLRLSRDFAT